MFYFRTNNAASRYQVIAIDVNHPQRASWRTIIPESDDVLQSVAVINNQFVTEHLHNAHSRVRLYSMDGTYLEDLGLPTLGSVGTVSGERDDKEMFYSFTSFTYPTTVFRHDFRTGTTSNSAGLLPLQGRHCDPDVPHVPEGHRAGWD